MKCLWVVAFLSVFPGSALGGAPSAESLIEGMEATLWSDSNHGRFTYVSKPNSGLGGLDGSAGLRWNYSELLSVVTWTGTGVLPLAQWVFLPLITVLVVKWMFLGWLTLRAK